MSVETNIDIDKFPKQGRYLNTRVMVCFDFDTSRIIHGVVVRDDAEEPGHMIIKLDNGRYVMATECQYTPLKG